VKGRLATIGLLACVLSLVLSIRASAQLVTEKPTPPYDLKLARPITLGSLGGNSAYNSEPELSPPCYAFAGTLGALLQDQNHVQYVLGAAHSLAIGPNAYFGSGSQEPILQPDLGTSFGLSPAASGCLPAAGVAAFEVATLSTVVAPNFTAGVANSADAAMAKTLAGDVDSGQYGIPTYSGVPFTVLEKGMEIQMFGAISGKTSGKIISKMLKPEKIMLCKHIETSTAKASCNMQKVLFTDVILTQPIGGEGDSGALVMTTGSCPQPVGIFEGLSNTNGDGFVLPIGSETAALISASAGAYTSLSVVPGGAGCTPGSITPDSDVVQAMDAAPGLSVVLGSNTNFQGCIDGIGIDLSLSVATLDVTADDGSVDVNGTEESCLEVVEDNVAAQLGSSPSFEGVPVETSQVDTADETGAFTNF
jgi:hypothetical protein